MQAKYYANIHPTNCVARQGSSSIWKRMLVARAIAEPYIHWIIVKGNIDAFRDKWCSSNVLQSNLMIQLHSFFKADGTPGTQSFTNLLGQQALDDTLKEIYISNVDDFCICSPSYAGNSTLTSAWQ